MKKIFTMVMLCIFTVMSAQAEEKTLWEGDHIVDWELPEGNANREWKELGQADFANYEVGQKLYFYFTVVGSDFHKYNFDNWGWGALPGHEGEHAEAFGINADTKVTFEVTQAIKDEIATNGFAIHGHGFKVVKVTTDSDEEQTDTEEQEVWTGDWWFSWEAANTDDSHKGWNAKDNGVDLTTFDDNQVIYIYLAMETDAAHFFGNEYHQYRLDDNSWTTLPGCAATDVASDTKVKLVVTPEIKTVLSGKSLEVHGHGLKVVRITKEVEKTTDGIVNVSTSDNYHPSPITQHPAFNLAGQRVGKNYKGVVIQNGKKYFQK